MNFELPTLNIEGKKVEDNRGGAEVAKGRKAGTMKRGGTSNIELPTWNVEGKTVEDTGRAAGLGDRNTGLLKDEA